MVRQDCIETDKHADSLLPEVCSPYWGGIIGELIFGSPPQEEALVKELAEG